MLADESRLARKGSSLYQWQKILCKVLPLGVWDCITDGQPGRRLNSLPAYCWQAIAHQAEIGQACSYQSEQYSHAGIATNKSRNHAETVSGTRF